MAFQKSKLPDKNLPADVQIRMIVEWLSNSSNQPYEGENSEGALVWCGDIEEYVEHVDRLCELIKER